MKTLITILICLFAFQIHVNAQKDNKIKDRLINIQKDLKEIKSNTKLFGGMSDFRENNKIFDGSTIKDITDQIKEGAEERQGLLKFAPKGKCNQGTPCYTYKNDLLTYLNLLNEIVNEIISISDENQNTQILDFQPVISIVDILPGQLLFPLAKLMETNSGSDALIGNTGNVPKKGPNPEFTPVLKIQWSLGQNIKELKLLQKGLPKLRIAHQINKECSFFEDDRMQILATGRLLNHTANGITLTGTLLNSVAKLKGDDFVMMGVMGWVAKGKGEKKIGLGIGNILNMVGGYFFRESQFLSNRMYHCQKVVQNDKIVVQNDKIIKQNADILKILAGGR